MCVYIQFLHMYIRVPYPYCLSKRHALLSLHTPPCGLRSCFLSSLRVSFLRYCPWSLFPGQSVFSSLLQPLYFLPLSYSGICGFPSLEPATVFVCAFFSLGGSWFKQEVSALTVDGTLSPTPGNQLLTSLRTTQPLTRALSLTQSSQLPRERFHHEKPQAAHLVLAFLPDSQNPALIPRRLSLSVSHSCLRLICSK